MTNNMHDPFTDFRLLPENFIIRDNSDEIDFCKCALNYALEHVISNEEKDLIHSVYWENTPKILLADRYNISPSAVTRRLTKSQKTLSDYISFALMVKRNHSSH